MIRVQVHRLAKVRLTLTALVLLMGMADRSFAQVTDTNVYIPSDYTSFQPPARGASYTDAVFGAAIKRLTDSMNMTRADSGGILATIGPEYSTMSPFNMDNSRLILQHFSYYGLYDGAGNYLKDLPLDVIASSEPRWSRKDPNILYYIRGNQLKQLSVGANAISVVRTFTEYAAITGAGESDISVDGDHFVLAGDRTQVFVYTISTDSKSAMFDTGGNSFDSLYISPGNQVTITWLSNGAGRYQGIELFDKNMNFQRQLTKAGGHMDIAADTNGDEVLLWTNSNDPAPIACKNGIVKVRLSDAKQTCLVQLDWSLAVHVSAPDNNGWVFVETYNPIDIIPPTGWKTYTNEFLQIKLDGTEVRRLAHHRSRPLNSYTYEPKISTSHDGSKIVFGSNFGLQAQQGNPVEYSDAYMIDLGPNGSPAPDPAPAVTTRVQQDGSGIAYAGSWFNNTNVVHSGGSAKLGMDPGSSVTFSFNGTGADWIGYSDEWSGIAKVTVDGISKGEIDTYKTPQKAQVIQFWVTGLAAGNHTLTIEPTGRRNAKSGGNWIWIDAFDSFSAQSATPAGALYRVEETAAAVKFSGNWFNNSNGANSGSSAKLAMDAGSTVSFTFTGNAITWIAYRDMWSGIARVTVDGIVKGDIDTYSAADSARSQIYALSNLIWGTHTITIEATGRRSASSMGAWIWVDAFDYNGQPSQ